MIDTISAAMSKGPAPRRFLAVIGVVAALGGVGLSGCGDDPEDSENPVPVPGEATVGANSDLAGTLHATPTAAEPGETVRIEVENLGEKAFS